MSYTINLIAVISQKMSYLTCKLYHTFFTLNQQTETLNDNNNGSAAEANWVPVYSADKKMKAILL